ncbi:hypothetical protein L596_030639 [Steinernema carpocapsae]|uniref:Peptidase S1 domain-containing protein n=1 Tax=Steinernema carpocapsae TaxID=34508 RepID=A0A4U5LPY8_STECR|nr:hypothetical protein L596_030639 [Steinernema carpocapsae]
MCGGTLITTTHVLTAGHCTAEMDAPARIMAGSVSLKEQSPNTQWRDIHSIYTYPTYDNDDPLVYDDIAIVEFNPPVSLNRDIQLVKIVKDDTELLKQTAALISGFGTYTYEDRQGEKMGKTSDELLWTQVQLFPWDYCNRQWGRTLNQKQICAGSKGRGTGGVNVDFLKQVISKCLGRQRRPYPSTLQQEPLPSRPHLLWRSKARSCPK